MTGCYAEDVNITSVQPASVITTRLRRVQQEANLQGLLVLYTVRITAAPVETISSELTTAVSDRKSLYYFVCFELI